MKLTLESFKDGKIETEVIETDSFVKTGWPETVVKGKNIFIIEEFDNLNATYRLATSHTFDI